jgi:hypothetical protein
MKTVTIQFSRQLSSLHGWYLNEVKKEKLFRCTSFISAKANGQFQTSVTVAQCHMSH